MMSNFYQFYGYDIEVHLDNLIITTALKKKEYGLCDQFTISAAENTSRTASFTFIPPEDTIDLAELQGQPVDIFIRDSTGFYQVFAGSVNVPTLDIQTRKITLSCTDERANKIIQLDYNTVTQIGLYSDVVFGTVNDQSDELEKRLKTVTASFDFDNYGNPSLTPWAPKDTPDFVYTSADVRQMSIPTVIHSPRTKNINTVNLTFNYNYQRLHQQVASFTWQGYTDFITTWFTEGKPSFPTRDQVQQAAKGTNWKLLSLTMTPLWPAGGYSGIVWQPNQVTESYVGRTRQTGYLKDSLGNFVTVNGNIVPQFAPVLDANGKQIMDTVKTSIIDTSSNLCRGVSFISALRFSQSVTETYNIRIFAPQSINQYNGVVDSNSTFSISDPFDTAIWDQSDTVTQLTQNFYQDVDPLRNNAIEAMAVAYAKAKHDILEMHRATIVKFQTKNLKPLLDLKHTVDFSCEDIRSTTSHIYAIGKVSAFTHTIDFKLEKAYTDVELLLSRSFGSVSDDNPSVNIPIQNPGYIGSPQNVVLGTHLGINPDPAVTPGADKWTGYVGNKEKPATAVSGAYRTTYPESFIVDFPPIPDSIRDEVNYSSDTQLIISIPNDYLDTSL